MAAVINCSDFGAPQNKVCHCSHCFPIYLPWSNGTRRRRQWYPTPVPLPGKSHGWRSLVGYSSRGHEESDTTERLHYTLFTILSSVAQLCPTLCDPRDYGTLGFPVHHELLGLTQTHAHQAGDAIQPYYPLSYPSLPTFNLSQDQGLFLRNQFFASGSQSIGMSASASVLPMNIQSWFPLGFTGSISLLSKRLSSVFLNTIVQKHRFFGAQLSL